MGRITATPHARRKAPSSPGAPAGADASPAGHTGRLWSPACGRGGGGSLGVPRASLPHSHTLRVPLLKGTAEHGNGGKLAVFTGRSGTGLPHATLSRVWKTLRLFYYYLPIVASRLLFLFLKRKRTAIRREPTAAGTLRAVAKPSRTRGTDRRRHSVCSCAHAKNRACRQAFSDLPA